MARYSVETRLDPDKVIDKATAYFGEGGVGLSPAERDACCITFEGGGGHVTVTAASEESRKTTVELETREWDYHVKRFMQEIS